MKKFVFFGLATFGLLLLGHSVQAAEINSDVTPELGKIFIDETKVNIDAIICTTSKESYVVKNNKLVVVHKLHSGIAPFVYHDVQLLSGQSTGYSFTIASKNKYTYQTTNKNSDWSPRAMYIIRNGAQIQYQEVQGTPASISDTASMTASYTFGLRNLSSNAMNYGMNIIF